MSRLAFRLLLRLYPRDFREEHGGEMEELFGRRRARCRGVADRGRLWVRTLRDTVENAWLLRRRDRRRSTARGGTTTMETMLQDLRHALRGLLRAPGFTLGAVALLAVGLGTNITVFAVVDALLLRPPPWVEPDRVVQVYQDSDDGEPSSSSYPAFRDMAESGVFESVTAMSPTFFDPIVWNRTEGPVELSAEFTTSTYLEVVGLSPLRGRWFDAEHDRPGAEPVAVVSARMWRTLLGGDPAVVGRTLQLNGRPVTVVGVGPDEIPGTYPPLVTDLWLSISATPVSGPFRVANLERRADHWYDVRARLAPGVTVEQAQAAMDALAARLAEDHPEFNRGRGITVFSDVRVHPGADGELRLLGTLLSAVVLTVLLLTCANLANLLVVRGLDRSGEMAVRRALGAGRGRVARLFLLEAFLLSGAGGVLGLGLALWALRVLPTLPVPFPGGGLDTLGIEPRVALFAAGLVLATALVFGLLPAWRSAGTAVVGALRADRRGASAGRGVLRLRNALVVVQMAASLVLVVGTVLLARSVSALQGTDPGVDADRVAWVQANLGRADVQGEEARVVLTELLERARALPGVEAAAASSRLPAQGGGSTTTVVEDYTAPDGTEAVELDFAVVTDGYFETVGIARRAGRIFGEADVPDGPTSVLVNETAAVRFWGGVDQAPGRRIRGQGATTWRTVVGVVADAPVTSLAEPQRPMIYFSARQSSLSAPYLLARTTARPEASLAALRDAVPDVRSSLTVEEQGTLRSHLGAGLETPRFATRLMGAFAGLALLLAGLGVYAVVSFGVARRSAELGIRMALGATRGGVVGMVLREVAGTVAVGVGVGVLLAGAATRPLTGLLYGVEAWDPVALGGASLFLTAAAALAAWLPARRAARTDPVEALRRP